MQTVGLFAGIGGLELGFERAGFETQMMAESDPLCQAVLARRFEGAGIFGDVCGLKRLPKAEVLVAGFPCQPYSQVGPARGLVAGEWHLAQIFRLIDSRHTPPAFIVLENVPNIVHLQSGRALLSVLDRLESRGYKWAYRVIDAAAFGLPQRRRRWFLVASIDGNPSAILLANDKAPVPPTEVKANGFYWTEGNRGLGWASDAIPPLKGGSTIGIPGPPAIWDHAARVVWTPDIRDAERLQGFRAGWTDVDATSSPSASRRRWRMIGNAVSVRVARWIAERIRDDASGSVDRIPFNPEQLGRAAFYDGKQRFGSSAGALPVRRSSETIMDFLQFPPVPLSRRATQGFRERYEVSSLRRNDAFVKALRYHELRFAG